MSRYCNQPSIPNFIERYNGHHLTGDALTDAREWLRDIGYPGTASAHDSRVVAYYIDQLYDGGLAGYIVAHDQWTEFQATR